MSSGWVSAIRLGRRSQRSSGSRPAPARRQLRLAVTGAACGGCSAWPYSRAPRDRQTASCSIVPVGSTPHTRAHSPASPPSPSSASPAADWRKRSPAVSRVARPHSVGHLALAVAPVPSASVIRTSARPAPCQPARASIAACYTRAASVCAPARRAGGGGPRARRARGARRCLQTLGDAGCGTSPTASRRWLHSHARCQCLAAPAPSSSSWLRRSPRAPHVERVAGECRSEACAAARPHQLVFGEAESTLRSRPRAVRERATGRFGRCPQTDPQGSRAVAHSSTSLGAGRRH